MGVIGTSYHQKGGCQVACFNGISGRKMIVAIAAVLCLLVAAGSIPAWAAAETGPVKFDIPIPAGVLMDAATGQILWAKNEHKRVIPASITKIMTLLLVMEAVDKGRIKLTDKVTASPRVVSMGGSQVYLSEGEVMTVNDLIKATAISSGNDSAVALAEYLAGTEENFVDAMNRRARELGMKDTHFYNATGLPPTTPGGQENYTSSYDVAVMSRQLLKHPRITRWSGTWMDKLRGGKFTLYNTNHLLKYYAGADGLKTGHTQDAGWCLAGTAKRGGWRLIAVTMGAATERERVVETARLLDHGYSSFQRTTIIREGQKAGTVTPRLAARSGIPVEAQESLMTIVPRGQGGQIKTRLILKKGLEAPLPKGAQVGRVAAVVSGREIASVPAITSEEVRKVGWLRLLWQSIARGIVRIFQLGRKIA